jgi:6-phosphogluconolactonase
MLNTHNSPVPVDARRHLVEFSNAEEMIFYCVSHFIKHAKEAIERRGAFFVALSGGSTPKSVYSLLSQKPYRDEIDWSKVYLFWSDERNVPQNHPDSNYHMAMEAGFKTLPIPADHIFPMSAGGSVTEEASRYEQTIEKRVPKAIFDLILLGMGDDGHTASLFPETGALHETAHNVVANEVPQLNTSRITMTFPCINRAREAAFYVVGAKKSELVKRVLTEPKTGYPAQNVGTSARPALWIITPKALS